MSVTLEQLEEIFPHAKKENLEKFCEPLNKAMAEFEIDNPKREAMFLAQCAHESGQFAAVSENLNYKAETLTKVFPKYFHDKDPNDYAKQPEKIANVVYANRMGNGDTESGDGYRYRGRGLIQLTGKNNYTKCGEALNMDLHEDSDYLSTPDGAARSAAWFWSENDLNECADADDIVNCTKKVNGGTLGLEEREAFWKKALEVLEG
jgi:putative chitinase